MSSDDETRLDLGSVVLAAVVVAVARVASLVAVVALDFYVFDCQIFIKKRDNIVLDNK